MDNLYIIGGIALAIFGVWLTVYEIRVFIRKEQGDLGYDVKGLGFGITCIIIGILLISKHI
jgi:hypothetical protein